MPRDKTPDDSPLKGLRTQMGLTRDELCRVAGLTYSYIANIEAGRVKATAKSFDGLAAFGVDVAVLVEAQNAWRDSRNAAATEAFRERLGIVDE